MLYKRGVQRERHKQGVTRFFLDLSIYLCVQNLAAFQIFSSQQGLIPSNLWKGQRSWGHKPKLAEMGPFPHIPCSYFTLTPRLSGRGHGRHKQLGSCSSITFPTFHFAGKLNPSYSTDSHLLGLPSAGQGQTGVPTQCCRHQGAKNILAPCSPLAINSLGILIVWKWFLMVPGISKAGLPSTVGKVLTLLSSTH